MGELVRELQRAAKQMNMISKWALLHQEEFEELIDEESIESVVDAVDELHSVLEYAEADIPGVPGK